MTETHLSDEVVELVARTIGLMRHGLASPGEYDRELARAALEAARYGELVQFARNVAEGNLGDAPWQANYEKLKVQARALLSDIEGPR